MTSFHQVNRPHGKSVRCQPLSFKAAIFQPVWYSATSLMGTQTTLIPTSKQKIMLQFIEQPIRLKPSTWKPYGQFKSPLISPASPLTGECVIPLCLHSSPLGCGSMSAGDLYFSASPAPLFNSRNRTFGSQVEVLYINQCKPGMRFHRGLQETQAGDTVTTLRQLTA